GGLVDVRELVRELDSGLCGRPALAALPGRFLFTVDDGRGDTAWQDGDVAALFVSAGEAAILLGGADVGARVPPARVAEMMLACAEAFLFLREDQWRVAELDFGPRRIADHLGLRPGTGPLLSTQPPVSHGPLGLVDQVDGRVAVGAAVPLGWL